MPQPRKKARSAGASTSAGTSGLEAGASTADPRRARVVSDAGPAAPPCLAPIAQREGPASGSSQRSGPEPTRGPEASGPEIPRPDVPSSSRYFQEESDELDSPIPEGSSAIHDAEVARAVFRRAMLPADRAEFRNISLEEVVDSTYCNTARASPFLDFLKVISESICF